MNYNGKSFSSKSELIQYAKKNRNELIELKKSETKHSDAIVSLPTKESFNVSKEEDGGAAFKGKVTVIANTYNYMDSHKDVHADGCFSKTISERMNKMFHLTDHEYKITAKVGVPSNIYEKDIKWSDLGVNKDGSTQALFMDSDLKKEWHPRIYDAYKNGEINQHSVGMQYVKIELAIDDKDEEYGYKLWKEYYSKLGNPEEADKYGFFYVVKEAKLREISSVLVGSNTLTPTTSAKNEPVKTTQEEEPLKSTQPISLAELMSNYKN